MKAKLKILTHAYNQDTLVAISGFIYGILPTTTTLLLYTTLNTCSIYKTFFLSSIKSLILKN